MTSGEAFRSIQDILANTCHLVAGSDAREKAYKQANFLFVTHIQAQPTFMLSQRVKAVEKYLQDGPKSKQQLANRFSPWYKNDANRNIGLLLDYMILYGNIFFADKQYHIAKKENKTSSTTQGCLF